MQKLLLSIILCFSILCTSLFGNPAMHFDKLEYDFGTVKQESIVKVSVIFKNDGDSNLIIKKIERSCLCVIAKVNKDKISPGEEGILEITLDSNHSNGKIIKTIFIYTNNPTNEMIIFKINANVIK